MSLDASWSTLWRPLVEIFILAVGIYYVLMFVRRTHGWGVLIGFLVLLGMLAVTALLDLSDLKWMLLQFFGFYAYAILILFIMKSATPGSVGTCSFARIRGAGNH